MNTQAITATRQLWITSTTEQKKALLRGIGFNESWAETKTIDEMAQRGGAMVAKEILRLMERRVSA